jgi:hypothetical protein
MNEIEYIRLFIDIVLFGGLAYFAYKFWQLQGVVVLSFRGALTILILLYRFKNLENPEKYLARLARISEDDAKLAITQGKMIEMLSSEAGNIINTLVSSVRGSREIVASIEKAYSGE